MTLLPIAKCNTCVCGCPRSSHQTVALSVELLVRPGGPLYKILGNVTGYQSGATRYTEQCICGCMSFEVD